MLTQHNAGISCYYLAGIHPRCIPPDLKPEMVGPLLMPYLEEPLCRGIGEIGIETGDTKEVEIFIAQLEAGRDFINHGKVIGVHTPRADKLSATETTLNLLAGFPEMSSLLVVDHCTAETIALILEAGLWAGITLNPFKTSLEELKRIILSCQDHPDRIMCNTDSNIRFFEDLVKYSQMEDLPEHIRGKYFYGNAARFFNI
jgi:uncharacterized protein